MTWVACPTEGTEMTRGHTMMTADGEQHKKKKKDPGCWLTFENNEATQAKEVAYSHNMTAVLLKERVYA
jgi:hypothetical protein